MTELQTKVNRKNATAKLLVCVVLREHPELRTIGKREKVAQIVQTIAELEGKGHIPTETIFRSIRTIQNKMKLYLPEKDDGRFEREQVHREFYRKEKESEKVVA